MSKRIAAAFAASMLTAIILHGPIQARTIPFISGRTNVSSSIGCLDVDFSTGGITNSGRPFRTGACSGSNATVPFYYVGFPVDSSGTKTVTIMARAMGSTGLTDCQVVGGARDLSMQSASPRINPSVPDVFTPIALPGVNVPSAGFLYATCFFSPGVTFSEASYNP